MDRYTFYLLEFLEDIHPASKANMNDLVRIRESMCYIGLQLIFMYIINYTSLLFDYLFKMSEISDRSFISFLELKLTSSAFFVRPTFQNQKCSTFNNEI